MPNLIATRVLDEFVVTQKLGSGTYATVYLCQNANTGETVVAKVPHAHLLEGKYGHEIRDRFEAEVDAATRVQGPGLPRVFGAGTAKDGRPVLVMEYIEGESFLDYLIDHAPLNRERVAKMFTELVSVVRKLHTAGIVHRDITPNNLMVVPPKESLVLLDFGIAKLDRLSRHTLGPVGTPRYIAPEQIHGKAVAKSDMFSIGAILWWALTGQEYMAEITHVGALLQTQLDTKEPPDPRDFRSSIPAEMALMVMQLLHPKPGFRPSAGTFLKLWESMTAKWSENHRTSTLTQETSAVSASEPRRLTVLVASEPNEAETDVLILLKQVRCKVLFARTADGAMGLLQSQDVDVVLAQNDLAVDIDLNVLGIAQARLLLFGGRSASWDSDVVAACNGRYVVPDELSRLEEALSALLRGEDTGAHYGFKRTPSAVRVTAALDGNVIEDLRSAGRLDNSLSFFRKTIPSWLHELESAVANRDVDVIVTVCQNIERSADLIGARPLLLHARSLKQLAEDQMFELFDGALGELQKALVATSMQMGDVE